jgi:hypothetical protein
LNHARRQGAFWDVACENGENIVLINTTYETQVDRLLEVSKRFAQALREAGIPYQIVGGFAVFWHVDRIDPIAARLTRDVDVAVDRADLDRIARVVKEYGFTYRHVAGVDMLVDASAPRARTAVHLIFVREKVRPEYLEPVPDFSEPLRTEEGVLLAPVADLVLMKLTSFRLKDKVHIQDMDSVGLITPEIEAGLSEQLRARLAEVRATE